MSNLQSSSDLFQFQQGSSPTYSSSPFYSSSNSISYQPCSYVVYILRSLSPDHSRKTYVGCAKDRFKRLRQHNGEITGGAKRTLIGRPWEMVCYFHGFPDRHTALQLEWAIQHSGMKPVSVKIRKGKNKGKVYKKRKLSNAYRGGGIEKRIQLTLLVLEKISFTSSSIPSIQLNLTLNWLVSGFQLNTHFPYLIEKFLYSNNSSSNRNSNNSNSNNTFPRETNSLSKSSNNQNNSTIFQFVNTFPVDNRSDNLFHFVNPQPRLPTITDYKF